VKQVEVQIMGHGYVLGCPEDGEARLNQAVAKVDEAMCKIRDAGKIKARDRIAVLAALNLSFDLTDRPAALDSSPQSLSTSQLQSLLQRMDAVLGHDNQLL